MPSLHQNDDDVPLFPNYNDAIIFIPDEGLLYVKGPLKINLPLKTPAELLDKSAPKCQFSITSVVPILWVENANSISFKKYFAPIEDNFTI